MPYEYPRAGRNAPPGVQAEIERFRRLPLASERVEKGQVPLLYFILGSGPNPYKMSRVDAAHQGKPVGKQRCGNCSSAYQNVVRGDFTCSQIEGQIKLNDWCRLWNTDRL